MVKHPRSSSSRELLQHLTRQEDGAVLQELRARTWAMELKRICGGLRGRSRDFSFSINQVYKSERETIITIRKYLLNESSCYQAVFWCANMVINNFFRCSLTHRIISS